jgi:hypothetical protein
MSTISITKLYDLLIPKLGKEETEGLISFLENKSSDGMETHTENLSMKAELTNFKSDLIMWMFTFWIAQMAVTVALISFCLKK